MISKVTVLHDVRSEEGAAVAVAAGFERLRHASTRGRTQAAVTELTARLLGTVQLGDPESTSLVPILRGGLAMWQEANRSLESPNTVFTAARKSKGTANASVQWISSPAELRQSVVILDTVVATGDTVKAVAADVLRLGPLRSGHRVCVLTCYCSPQALAAFAACELAFEHVGLAVLAAGVDDAGFLQPPTHGDIGDKLFT